MCVSWNAVPHSPHPRWKRLFAILPFATAALVVTEVMVGAGKFRVAANIAIVLATFGAMALWLRGNRTALGQLERCACASEMLTIRVVTSRPELPSRQGSVKPIPAVTHVSAPAGDRTGARLGA